MTAPASQTSTMHAAAHLRLNYRTAEGLHDEMCTPDGILRPHWRPLIAGLESLGPTDLNRRTEAARALIQEHGITYNIHGDPDGLDRPWELDVVPLVIDSAEWKIIEAGLIQRAEILNRVISDIYGRQTLLRDGHIPASLVFANPRFLRPCHGITPPGGTFVNFYAVDLGRAPDGRWWVLNDRTQAPSGAGYALENRIVTSRVMPDLIRDTHVHRLAGFFQHLRDALRGLAPHTSDPRVVLLTPGPYTETYFEHVYLSRYLGFTLVEGGDLTVRDNKVYLKTLSGLHQVDVILRRLDDDFCDPLELREDSHLGVPGLLQAYRAGTVAIANAPGCGLVESQAFMSFLPGLCRLFTGENLLLPSVATWWCGQDAPRDAVLDRLDQLVIKPTFNNGRIFGSGPTGIEGSTLTEEHRDELAERIRQDGHDFLGQETVTLSTAPILRDGHLAPGTVTLRAFVAARADGGYTVMPGGLTRVSTHGRTRLAAMQNGDGSKDTWVIADGPVSTLSLLRPAGSGPALRRSGRDIPSRAADNLFWLGRYAERAEGVMRLLRALLIRLTGDLGSEHGDTELRSMMQVLVRECGVAPHEVEGSKGISNFDPRYGQSLSNTLTQLHRAAGSVRDRLSLDAWRILHHLRSTKGWHTMTPGRAARAIESGQALATLDSMITLMSAFSGMENENMTRGHGWTFIDMGRRLERGMHMTVLLKVLLSSSEPEKDGSLELLLELADSFMTYRSRYLSSPYLAPVVDLLLADDSNPRSVAFQMAALDRHAATLPGDRTSPVLPADQRVFRDLSTRLQLADVVHLCRAEQAAEGLPELNALLETIDVSLPLASDAISGLYFNHLDRVDRTTGPLLVSGMGEAP